MATAVTGPRLDAAGAGQLVAKHAITGSHMSEDIDTTFSPLSSSTITIVSLGSSLAYGSGTASSEGPKALVAHSGVGSHTLAKDTGVLDSDDEDAGDSSDAGCKTDSSCTTTTTDARRGDLVQSKGVEVARFDSAVDCGHSPVSLAGSPGPGSPVPTASNSESQVSDGGARAVGLDIPGECGLQILHASTTDACTPATGGDKVSATGKAPSPFLALSSRPPSPLEQPAPKARPSVDRKAAVPVRDTAVAMTGVEDARGQQRRSLAKRILRPLSWRSAGATSEAGAAAAATIHAMSSASTVQQPSIVRAPTQSSPVAGVGTSGHGDRFVDEPERTTMSPRNSEETCTSNDRPPSAAAAAATNVTPALAVGGEFPHTEPSKPLAIKRTEALMLRRPLRRKTEHVVKSTADSGSRTSQGDAKEQAVGPVRFQALSRTLGSRLGLSSVLAERRRQPGDLRFVIAPHPLLSEVVEVYDCDEAAPVYRKVSRSAKSWHETFHEVDPEAEAEAEAEALALAINSRAVRLSCGSALAMVSPLGLPYPVPGLAQMVSSAASCVSFHSAASSAAAAAAATGRVQGPALDSPITSSTSSLVNLGTVHMGRARTSVGYTLGNGRGTMAMSMYGGIPGMAFDNGMLWEARTPFPNQFPLHVKDTRKVIDTTSMASMVLDRHNFCYRFQLGTNRMRWMAKRARKHQLVLHCLVRNTLVAEIFVDYEKGYSPYNMLSLMKQSAGFGSGSTSGVSTPMEIAANARNAAQNVGAAADLPEDGSLPVVTILPALFDQLSEIDADVVESFAIFTGMQTLECLHI